MYEPALNLCTLDTFFWATHSSVGGKKQMRVWLKRKFLTNKIMNWIIQWWFILATCWCVWSLTFRRLWHGCCHETLAIDEICMNNSRHQNARSKCWKFLICMYGIPLRFYPRRRNTKWILYVSCLWDWIPGVQCNSKSCIDSLLINDGVDRPLSTGKSD